MQIGQIMKGIYDKLAPRYDLATKVISFGIEEWWRGIFVKKIKEYIKDGVLLDVASATGEMAKIMDFREMILLDPSTKMNKIAYNKLKDKNITIIEDFAESAKIPKSVDIITAFMAVRNFDNLQQGVKNLDKYLKKGGYFAILELTKSDTFLFDISMFYISKVAPFIGGMITGEYESYKKFDKMIKNITDKEIIESFNGYEVVYHKKLFPPIATIIILKKG
jgi:ubiquinone/menaquinone biosynthesis methyltransferase